MCECSSVLFCEFEALVRRPFGRGGVDMFTLKPSQSTMRCRPGQRLGCASCSSSKSRINRGREGERDSDFWKENTNRVHLGLSRRSPFTSSRSNPVGSVLLRASNENPRDGSAAECEGEKHVPTATKRLAVFASGGGSNFRAVHAAIEKGKINGKIELVVSDKASCGATEYATEHGIACLKYPDRTQQDAGLQELLTALKEEHAIDYVILAGYMKMVPPELVRAFERGILNMHPALLPAFGGKGYYGIRVHEAVVQSGARFSGATVHFVDEEYDRGPIVAQVCVPVFPEDTAEDLSARVLKREHELYPHVVAALCENRIQWTEEGKPILWAAV